ncbi:MAG: MOSC N-terminal beta barrel domain-containing protein [Planctomycetota bacterium]
MPQLSRITIFPIKSLDGCDVSQAAVSDSGCLAGDRRFAITGADGRIVNGKRCAGLHAIRARWEDAGRSVELSLAGNHSGRLDIEAETSTVAEWLSDALGQPCRLARDERQGFPDDTDAAGPTLISTATLREVAGWFGGLSEAGARRRFRANLEIDPAEPFWEDRLVADGRFSLGPVVWQATGVCQRCVVPTRDPDTGERTAGFAKRFSRFREESLPGWSPRSRFDHFFRLAINTRLVSRPAVAAATIGDELLLLGTGPAL